MSQDSPRHRLQRLDVDRELATAPGKRRYVRTLFDTVESSYDRFTRRFSFGMDRVWKRRLVDDVLPRLPADARVLDLATGTGDLAGLLRRHAPALRIAGSDLSRRMLQRGRSPTSATAVQADMVDLPHPDASFDLVTAGYAFRNAPDARRALREVRRILVPGGLLASLDFFVPRHPAWRGLYLAYLRHAGRLAGRLTHGDPATYGYIASSLEHWMTAGDFSRLLQDEGFAPARMRRRLGGGIAIHVSQRTDRTVESGVERQVTGGSR